MHIRCFFFPFIFGFFILFVDSSGMDFRSMLKKKKYAKWGNDDEGLYIYVATKSICLDFSNFHPRLFCRWFQLIVTLAWSDNFQTKCTGPDWGDLKHHDKPEEPVLKDEKPVRFTLFHVGQDYFQEVFIRGISMKTTLMFQPNMSNIIQIFFVPVHISRFYVFFIVHCR